MGDELWLEVSEAVVTEDLQEAVAVDRLTLTDTAAETALALTATQPVQEGRQAFRRIVLAMDSPPSAGTDLELRVEPQALKDAFGNRPEAPYTLAFPWPAGDIVLDDTAPPETQAVRLQDRFVEIELTEEPDLASLETAVTATGQTFTWTLSANRYTVRTTEALPVAGTTLRIDTTLEDLAGTRLTKGFEDQVPGTTLTATLFEAPDSRESFDSTVENRAGFHGLDHDAATGLVYVRNRWLDSQSGHFISPDPLSYADGPSLYQVSLYNPIQYSDPLGLYAEDFHFGMTLYLARLAGFSRVRAAIVAHSAQRPDKDERRPVAAGKRLFFRGLYSTEQEHSDASIMRTWHFPLKLVEESDGGQHLEVVPGSSEARQIVNEGIRSGDLIRFGEGLHPLQDSFSHQGVPARFYDDGDSTVIAGYGHPRGGLLSSKADKPEAYPSTAFDAIYATFEAMVEFRKINDGISQQELHRLWESYAEAASGFSEFVFTDDNGRQDWLLTHGIAIE